MSMSTWAEQEIEIACKRENSDYGKGCYKSALKAFKSLCEDGHSGMSIQFTKYILNRMIDGKPLSEIEDTEDNWNEVSNGLYQCKRMSSLFKQVDKSGNITYNDLDRVIAINIENNSTWEIGIVRNIINDMFPIVMPYYPKDKPYKLFVEEYLFDKAKGDCDTIHILYCITPEGKRIEIERAFNENSNGEMVEMPMKDFKKLKRGAL